MNQTLEAPSNDLLSTAGHYRRWVAAGDFVYSAGLTPRDAQRRVIGQTIQDQTVAVLRLLDEVLAEAGATRASVVKLTVFLSDLRLMGAFNVAYAAEMGALMPARTTVGCELNGVLIEIDAVAFKQTH